MVVDLEAKMEGTTRKGHNLQRPRGDLGLPAPPKGLVTFKVVLQSGHQASKNGPVCVCVSGGIFQILK